MKGKNRPGNFNFFFLHFEKIVTAILVLAAVYCGYSSTNLPMPTWKVPDLERDAQNAETHISQQKVSVAKYIEKMPSIPYEEYTQGIKVPIAAAPYATPVKWEPSVFPEKVARGLVKVFPLEKLVATAGIGGIVYQPEASVFGGTTGGSPTMETALGGSAMGGGAMGGGSGGMGGGVDPKLVKGTRWVVLTGLIPTEKQLEEYFKVFANATHTNPMEDRPNYMFYRVERHTVGNHDPNTGEPLWEHLKVVENFDKNTKQWQGFGLDPVDIDFIIPRMNPLYLPMAYPLPPAINKMWGKEVAHPPQIPLMADTLIEAMESNQEVMRKMLEESKETTGEEELLKAIREQGKTGAMTPGGSTGLGSGGMGGMSGRGGGMPGMGGGMPGMDSGGMGGMRGGTTGGLGMGQFRARDGVQAMVYQKISYSLFRYFDFDVEPGKTYQYRVQLVLKNPNERITAKHLADPELAKPLFLETPVSAVSNPATVISSSRILVQKVNPLPANRFWEGQTGSVASIAFDMEECGEYVVSNETAVRGRILNFLKKAGPKHNPSGTAASSASTMMPGDGPGGGPGAPGGGRGTRSPKQPSDSKTLDHVSGVCMADIYGGKKLIGSKSEHTIPGQTMVMSFDGTLQIRTVEGDSMEWKRYDPVTKAAATTGMPGMGRPE